jgi:hypothetical protein
LHYTNIMKIAESESLNDDDELRQDEGAIAAAQSVRRFPADAVRLQPLTVDGLNV